MWRVVPGMSSDPRAKGLPCARVVIPSNVVWRISGSCAPIPDLSSDLGAQAQVVILLEQKLCPHLVARGLLYRTHPIADSNTNPGLNKIIAGPSPGKPGLDGKEQAIRYFGVVISLIEVAQLTKVSRSTPEMYSVAMKMFSPSATAAE